jgi:prepilin-type N-terminal cleavage/methylation domain-containing protein
VSFEVECPSRLRETGADMRDGYRRSREQGVTLVELLITIIIAGIVFAALVPVFVNAAQSSARDNARTAALGVAQDKLERIRGLPYGDITPGNLNDGPYASDHGLGNTASVGVISGGKEYLVAYDVQRVYPADLQNPEPGLELYKQVTVDVYWEGGPRPVKHTLLRTDVYRQYAAPTIVGLDVAPISQVGNTQGMVVPGPDRIVTITAYVETAVAVKEVRFTVTSANGSYEKSFTETVGTGGVYVCQWLASDAPDGFFRIAATAASQAGYASNTWHLVVQLETGKPPSPVNLVASPGNNSVTLDWAAPAAGDIAYYEIWRSTTADRSVATLLATRLDTLHYPDTSVTNDTRYYYWVYAIDLLGNTSDPPATADATPSLTAGDHTPPTVPILTAIAGAMAINLTWTPSLDPDPSSGIGGYEIFRSTDGINFSPWAPAPASATTYSDVVGTDSPQYWYEIRAVDASVNANRSAFSGAVGPLWTPITKTTLTVTNNRTAANRPCTVTVQNNLTKLYYDQNGNTSTTPPPSPSIPSKGGSAQWQNLPIDGSYTVTATYTSGTPLVARQSVPPPWTVSFK